MDNRRLKFVSLAVGAGLVFLLAGCGLPGYNTGPRTTTTRGSATTNTQPNANSNTELDRQMTELAKQLVHAFAADQKPRVVVVDFLTMDGQESKIGKYVAEKLRIELFRTQRCELVERARMNQAEQELHLSNTDMFDHEKATQFGKFVGARAVATGTVTDRGSDFEILAKVFETETTTQIGGGSVVIPQSNFLRGDGSPAAVSNGSNGTAHYPGESDGGKSTPGYNPYAGGIDISQFQGDPEDLWGGYTQCLLARNFDAVRALIHPDFRYGAPNDVLAYAANQMSMAGYYLYDYEEQGNYAALYIYDQWGNAGGIMAAERLGGRWFLRWGN